VSEAYRDRDFLVTGGAGFIGSHLVEELVRRGANVVTIVDSLDTGRIGNLASVSEQINLVELDLRHDDLRPLLAGKQFDTLFHLAANANVTGSVSDPRLDLEKNILGTFNVLQAIREASPRTKVIFASSATVYGEGVTTPIKEDDAKVPTSPYGVSKLAAEHYVRLYAELYGLKTAIARMFSVFGPRLRKQVVFDLMCKLRDDPDVLHLHGDGTQVRDMNYVANVADAILLIAARAPLGGESYNVASGDQVSIKEIAGLICEGMGLSPKLVFSGEVRAGETQKWYPDHARLTALGYRPSVALRIGLERTIQWFQKVGGRE